MKILLSIFFALTSLLTFAIDDNTQEIDSYNIQAMKQRLDASSVICKIATYRMTSTSRELKPGIIDTAIKDEAIVLESLRGNCQSGDKVMIRRGGTEPGKMPAKPNTREDCHRIVFVLAQGLKKLDDGTIELIDSEYITDQDLPYFLSNIAITPTIMTIKPHKK